MSVQAQLERINQHIGSRSVTLVAVTKYTTLEKMEEAYAAGIRHFGEARVLDALKKKQELPEGLVSDIQWHLIGHLQTNKVNKTVGEFALIHSVDSLRLAQKISEANEEMGQVQSVLLQVNVAGEAQKYGFSPQELETAFQALVGLKGIEIRGLMAMAPHTEDTLLIQSVFGNLKKLRERLRGSYGLQLPELSMGMTHDYLHALELGATMIRIGSFLF